MSTAYQFYGVGVGPGEPGLIPLNAWEALHQCDRIYVPRARSAERSVARDCLPPMEIDESRFREVEFVMDPDRDRLRQHYRELGGTIADEIRQGRQVAYLTLGDPFTYSTYSYTLDAVQACVPGLRYRTFPGVASFCAAAAAVDWPIGEGKERVLILPCPEEIEELRTAIHENDVVILMKIGRRLPAVLRLLEELGIKDRCALASRVGLPDAALFPRLARLEPNTEAGYLATLLIRRHPRETRHI